MSSLNYGESPNLIDTQTLISKPNYSEICMTKNVPSSDDPSNGGDEKRRKIDGFYESATPELFLGSSEISLESGGSPEETVVADREACPPTDGMNRSVKVSHGSVSVVGRRRAMEDAIAVVSDLGVGKEFSFWAVYDGHGGARVSKLCRDKLHEYLSDEMKTRAESGDERGGGGGERDVTEYWERVMLACFKKMHEEVVGCGMYDDEDETGSTATVAVIGKDLVVVANCGDSRAVLSRGESSIALSRDHKPDRQRVESSGGRARNQGGSRLSGVLTTSRSIGYKNIKPYVSSEPEVTVTKRTESDQFLIIATDGLWDVVSNEVACDIVTKCLSGKIAKIGSEKSNDASEAAAKLAEMAIAKGSRDNISVIVVELNKRCR